jgi:hypothetical protein
MSENKEVVKNGAVFTSAGAAIGTIAAAVTGTALAAPAAIGAGVALTVYGVVRLIKELKD